MQTTEPEDIEYRRPPRTPLEAFDMLPEGTLAEIIDGAIYVYPTPNIWHQETLAGVITPIYLHVNALNLGECLAAPLDVYLDDRNVVQPDILFISNENMGIVKNGRIKGTPDLLIEITANNDKQEATGKKELYERFGVKEYFIVDPASKEVITYHHNGREFVQQESEEGKIVSRLLGKEFMV